MVFQFADTAEFLRLLRQHPEWRDDLRRELLSQELLELPDTAANIARNVERMSERLDRLTERVEDTATNLAALTRRVDDIAVKLAALTERVDAFAGRVDSLAQRLDQLTETVEAMNWRLGRVEENLNKLTGRVDNLDGRGYELRFNAQSRISQLIRGARRTYPGDIADVQMARDEGRLTEAEHAGLASADFIFVGRDGPGSEAPMTYVVMELSMTVDRNDVQRAYDRAAILRNAGLRAKAAVGGQSLTEGAKALSGELDVAVLADRP